MRAILFDIDGTLIDGQAIIHQSMRLTFMRWGFRPPSAGHIRGIIGLPLDHAIASILDREVDNEILEMAADYREAYQQLAAQPLMQALPYAGITSLIDRFARLTDIRLGLVTGKSRRGVVNIIKNPQFKDRFTVARCADDCPSKPHPAMVLECCDELNIPPSRTIVVGDTAFDMEMAKAARVSAIGVSWGYHSSEQIATSGAQQIVSSVHGLQIALENWIRSEDTSHSGNRLPLPADKSSFQYA